MKEEGPADQRRQVVPGMVRAKQHRAVTRLPREQVYLGRALTDDRYDRRAERAVTPVPECEWAEYREACALLGRLREYDGFYEGGPDEGAYIEEPRPRVHYTYLETVDEWLARCAELEMEGQ